MCRALAEEGNYVSAWVRRAPVAPIEGIHYRVQDVRDATGVNEGMKADAPHQVFHLAAITSLREAEADPIAAQTTNVQGTHNVMQAVPSMATAVFASTCHVYGSPQSLPIGEDHPCSPVGVYASTKAEAESVALSACPRVVIARAFHHTGRGQSTQFALADWAAQISAGTPIRTGNLSLRRDYSDVRDICRGYRCLAAHGAPLKTYNLCTGQAPTLRELLEGMAPGRQLDIIEEAGRLRAFDISTLCGDPSRAEALGWCRQVTQAEMLRDLVSG
jgi:GDP-4-dehydro-6-deoxy-D-mannose reductase